MRSHRNCRTPRLGSPDSVHGIPSALPRVVFFQPRSLMDQCHNRCLKCPANEDSPETRVPNHKENFQTAFLGELDGNLIGYVVSTAWATISCIFAMASV